MVKLTEEDFVTSAWSGGTTTQLLIAPAGAVYAERDFLWRVSSAAVELEESDFTPLPDYRRLIATLRGEIVLRHNDAPPVRLRPYEVHAFDGSDRTRSEGRCTDFNLMLRKGRAEGRMEARRLTAPETLLPDGSWEQQLLFCAEGECLVSARSEDSGAAEAQARLCAGEALLLNGPTPAELRPRAPGAAVMICRMRRISPKVL